RSTLYTIKSTDPYLCDDNLKPGWYVFEGFKDMPTSCVQQYHCGTHAPIWMNGAYPSVHDGIVQREACINYGVPANPTKCCNNKIDIRVKNCGGYMVYDLKSTPSCAEAYCADLYPKLLNFPKLEIPEVVQNIVRFPCKIPYKTGIPDVGFEVTWTVDNQPLKDPTSGKLINTTLTGDSRTAYLDASKLQGNLGKDVRCMVSSFHPSSPQSKSKLVPSNAYWAGIRVSTGAIEVDESGAEKELTLESTLPIICNAINQNECKLTVELHQNLDPTDTSWTSCAVDLKPDPVTHIYKGTVKVKATRDFINEHYDKVHQISFDPITDFFHPTFVGYKVTPVTINFASGARIAIQAYVLRPHGTHERDGMLNVAVQAPTDDLKSAEGLCGNWDGKASTQFQGKNGHIYNSHQTSQFANTWLLSHKESLFYNLPKYESSLRPDHEYCACKKSTVDCRKGNGANNPSKNNQTQDSRSSVVSRRVKAEFVSFMEVSCPLLPDLLKQGAIYQEFNVSMTVDGITYSSELPFVVYDSHCLDCENANHCRNEMVHIIMKKSDDAPDIIAVTEVLPKNARYTVNKAELSLSGYEMFPGNFPTIGLRVVLLYVRNELKAVEVESGSEIKESIWVKINLKDNDKLLVGCVYKNPSSTEENHKLLNDMVRNINAEDIYSHILVAGDFNFPDINWTTWNSRDKQSIDFIESLRDGFLEQMIDKPTRFRINQTPSLLDLILVNDSNAIQSIDYLSPIGNSDHSVLRFLYKCYIDIESENTTKLNYFKE
ncbi:hypothetical protein FSP39_001163, partial [Pinctada imbricata]